MKSAPRRHPAHAQATYSPRSQCDRRVIELEPYSARNLLEYSAAKPHNDKWKKLKIIDARRAHARTAGPVDRKGWFSKRFRDRAPARIIKDPNGRKGLFFTCEKACRRCASLARSPRVKTSTRNFSRPVLEEAPAGGWDPAARLKDMELDGGSGGPLHHDGLRSVLDRRREFQEDCFRFTKRLARSLQLARRASSLDSR